MDELPCARLPVPRVRESGRGPGDPQGLLLLGSARCRMVWPVSRGRLVGVGFMLFSAMASRAAIAAEATVAVPCEELSSEDRAQLEARVRANLLNVAITPTDIILSCDAASVRTEIRGPGREVSVRSERNALPVQEALLASADAALSGWDSERTLAIPLTPVPPPPAPSPAPASVTAPVNASPQPAATARPAVRPSSTTWFFAGIRAEPWRDGSGLGAQLGAEHRFGAGFASIQGAYLFALPSSADFTARELQFGAQLGWQLPPLLRLRAAFGFGVSMLGVNPAPGVSAPGASTSTAAPFLNVEVSRPIEFSAFAVVPALGLRAFPASRAVLVNEQPALKLPAVTFAASLNVALRVGG